jgi:hypothetical protein
MQAYLAFDKEVLLGKSQYLFLYTKEKNCSHMVIMARKRKSAVSKYTKNFVS